MAKKGSRESADKEVGSILGALGPLPSEEACPTELSAAEAIEYIDGQLERRRAEALSALQNRISLETEQRKLRKKTS